MLRAIPSVSKIAENPLGFTISEIMIALAITSFVVMAIMTVTSQAMLAGKSSENHIELSTDFGLLQNYFAREIPNAGGMSLPADSAFWVENSCAARPPAFPDSCDRSDRLTIASSDIGPVCTVKSWNASTLTAHFPANASTTCCLITSPIYHKHVMFVNGYDFRQLWVSQVNTSACTAQFVVGPMAAHDNTASTYNWKNASVIPIDLDTFYLEMSTNTFMRYVYRNGGSSGDEGETYILADRMLDFQATPGFDFQPADGVIDDLGTTTDEWLYNVSGDSVTSTTFASLPRNSLRMIGIGWVIGAPSMGGAGIKSTSVLDGPVRTKTGYILQAGAAKFGVRSVYVFD